MTFAGTCHPSLGKLSTDGDVGKPVMRERKRKEKEDRIVGVEWVVLERG